VGASEETATWFHQFNGAAASGLAVVHVAAEADAAEPVHLLYVSTSSGRAPGAGLATSCPRCLIDLEPGARAKVVEEFVPVEPEPELDDEPPPHYFSNTVTEVLLGEGAALEHTYVNASSPAATHLKGTFVLQQARSSYRLVEAALGGKLARHDLQIRQLGPETHTVMRQLCLAGEGQVQDLHSKLVLDHPGGEADQLHKCIVTSPSSTGVFDGNVRVNQLAQQTDAGQLTRNLILARNATIQAKPNLMIVADDVACTHGCSISDFDDESLFYFASRGVDPLAARRTLVKSFALEITGQIEFPELLGRVVERTAATLKDAV